MFLDINVHVNQIHEAHNGSELINILKSSYIDLIFMDVEMPGMDGIQATRLAKIICPEIKIIATGIYKYPSYYDSILKAGAIHFFPKDMIIESITNEFLKGVIEEWKYPNSKY